MKIFISLKVIKYKLSYSRYKEKSRIVSDLRVCHSHSKSGIASVSVSRSKTLKYYTSNEN